MTDRSEALSGDRVVPLLRGRLGAPYLWSEECRSTQDALLHSQWKEGAVSVAEHQSGGRGRQSRAWTDTSGLSLLLSLLLRPQAGSPVEQLSLVVGLATADSIDALSGTRTQLKWPNDVLVDGRKVAGILLESSGATVVCGIGINVNQTEDELPTDTRVPAGSLRLATGREHDRAALLASLLLAIEQHYDAWRENGLERFSVDLERRDALRGRRISVGELSGTAAGIAGDGRLRVVHDDGMESLVASGEVRDHVEH